MKFLRFLLLFITALLCGCVYHQAFEQGNIVTPKNTQSITLGMSSEAVIAKLGNPLLENIYADNRLVYVYTQQPTRHKTIISRFIVEFQNNRVMSIKTDIPQTPSMR